MHGTSLEINKFKKESYLCCTLWQHISLHKFEDSSRFFKVSLNINSKITNTRLPIRRKEQNSNNKR